MLKERKFDRAFIGDVVCNPERKEHGVGDVWYAYRRAYDEMVRVVVNGKQKPYIVITMHYDRRLVTTHPPPTAKFIINEIIFHIAMVVKNKLRLMDGENNAHTYSR